MSNTFLDSVKQRRSIYALDKKIELSNTDIQHLVEQAILQAPSAFGQQPARVAILLGKQHDKVWSMAEAALRKIVPTADMPATEARIASFKAGYGTILFFNDQAVTETMQARFVPYAQHFPDWSMQAHGIAMYSVWSALAAQQIGASIQHYSNLIEQEIKKEWPIPASWQLHGQMPFGGIAAPATEKSRPEGATLVRVIV